MGDYFNGKKMRKILSLYFDQVPEMPDRIQTLDYHYQTQRFNRFNFPHASSTA